MASLGFLSQGKNNEKNKYSFICNTMAADRDFGDEFGEIRSLPSDMVDSDKLLRKIKRSKLLDKLEAALLDVIKTNHSESHQQLESSIPASSSVASNSIPTNTTPASQSEPSASSVSSKLDAPISGQTSSIQPQHHTDSKYARIRGLALRRLHHKKAPQASYTTTPSSTSSSSTSSSVISSLHPPSINHAHDNSPLTSVYPTAENPLSTSGTVSNKDTVQSVSRENSKSLKSRFKIPRQTMTRARLPPQTDQVSIKKLRHEVLSQLHGNFANLHSSALLKDKYQEVYRMIEHTVRDKEGHSALLIGPRATGKSAIIDAALKSVQDKYPGHFITIRLNAHIHTDDNIALRAIAKQIDKDLMVEEDDVMNEVEMENNEETAVDDEGEDDDDDEERATFERNSINETFANILATLDVKGGDDSGTSGNNISFVFVIDEFEKFTTYNKQTLLYNLFDLAQNSKTAVCVIGVTTKITARELLEKRVRSRFSNRVISLNKPKTVQEFWDEAKLSLIVDERFSASLPDKSYGQKWNAHIEKWFCETKAAPSALRRLVHKVFFTTKNFRDFNNHFTHAVNSISIEKPYPSDDSLIHYGRYEPTNNIQSMFEALSSLELLLVIAAARWLEKSELQIVNYNLAYSEYVSMLKIFNVESTASRMTLSSALDNQIIANIKVTQKIWPLVVLRNCWETIYKLGLLVEVSKADDAGSVANNSRNLMIDDSRMVQLDVTLEELGVMMHAHHTYKRLTRL